MKIDNELIKKIFGINIKSKINCISLGLIPEKNKLQMLTFLSEDKFLQKLESHKNISAVFTTKSLAKKISSKKIIKIICKDPRACYYKLYNYIARYNYKKKPNKIGHSAKISPQAFIAEYNVIIGKDTVIEPFACILPDVELGRNCIIRSGAKIGCEGFELKRTDEGIISVIHDGKAILEDGVEVGANTTIYKGFSYRDTIIGKETKIDNLVYIAHGVQIGNRCFIVGNAMISGSSTLGNNVWVGPGVTVSNQVTIGDKAYLSIGSVVDKDVGDNEKVTGNFAIPHDKFISHLKYIYAKFGVTNIF